MGESIAFALEIDIERIADAFLDGINAKVCGTGVLCQPNGHGRFAGARKAREDIEGWCWHLVQVSNRDREAPHDASPPTPPGIRITYHGSSVD